MVRQGPPEVVEGLTTNDLQTTTGLSTLQTRHATHAQQAVAITDEMLAGLTVPS